MSLSVTQIPVSGFDENISYLVSEKESGKAFLVDPSGDIRKVYGELERLELTLIGILITHTHADHIDQLDDVLRRYNGLPIYVHITGAKNIETLGDSTIIGLKGKEEISLGDASITVLHTPGHSTDSVCFLIEEDNSTEKIPQLISGDTLFVEGCGRTDETHVRALYDSLQTLKRLSARTIVYPGHDYGPSQHSTIGHEKKHNRFLTVKDFRGFKKERLS